MGPQRNKRFAGSAFPISFQPDWQVYNGIFKRPIMARTQILVHKWGQEQGFRRFFVDRLNQSLVSCMARARLPNEMGAF